MRYTIWSGGRLVGESDLAFARVMDEVRCGWFMPTAEGERVLAVATAVAPALRAARSADAPELPDIPETRGSSRAADLAEALHHVSSLELELRDGAGRVVPTEDIGFQDTHVLVELAREAMEELDSRPDWEMDDDPDALFDTATLDELEVDDGAWREELGEPRGPFVVDADDDAAPPDGERYQVIVTLTDPASIP